MELYRVDQIFVDSVTEQLLDDVDIAARKVNELRPMSSEALGKVRRDLLGERVYSSNAIEGNTYDLRETVNLLETGHIDPARKREGTEVLNLRQAIDHIQEHLIKPDAPYIVEDLLHVHGILLKDIKDEWAGRFREHRVMIDGAKHQPPNDRDVPNLVDECVDQLNDAGDMHPVVLAAWTHWALARVHPFDDGNGRTARLWQDIVLFKNRLTCAIIRPTEREEYLASLQSADDGDFSALIQLVARRVILTLDRSLAAQAETDELGEWAATLAQETDARVTDVEEKRTLAYQRWTLAMDKVHYAFERCAARVAKDLDTITVQLKTFDIIDQATWTTLHSGSRAGGTWFFLLTIHRDRQPVPYSFYFGPHYPPDGDADPQLATPGVALLVLEQSPGRVSIFSQQLAGNAVWRRGNLDSESPLSFREVFVVDNELIRKRVDPESGEEVFDRNVEPIDVAKDFLEEVMRRRLT